MVGEADGIGELPADIEGIEDAGPFAYLPSAAALTSLLDGYYQRAVALVEADEVDEFIAQTGELGRVASDLGQAKHASRGALLTLALYKSAEPSQDIRYNKAEHDDGFSARAIDSNVTVPFLMQESLPKSVESHWLTQTLSFAEPWTRAVNLKTQPKKVGPLLIEAVNLLQELPDDEQQQAAESVAVILMARLVAERNRSKVDVTRPKGLTIAEIRGLLNGMLRQRFKTGSPRLPQLMIYAIYQALFEGEIARYADCTLEPVGRMKAADRKSGTVGDIVVSRTNRPMEAVETKYDLPITLSIVGEAMEKVKSHSVERYLILSTAGIDVSDREQIMQRIEEFKRSNGCEIIVNGVLETVCYYLRLLPNTNAFVDAFAALLESDEDLDYEHRVAWNAFCAER